jgi:hypothetical protein
MPVKIFSLKNVPDDEQEEIRDLLIENKIDYYETPGGNWGISMPAIWINDDSQFEQVKLLIDQYQKKRSVRIREEYEKLKKEGKHQTFIEKVISDPIRSVIYILIALGLMYISIKPFMTFVN